MQGDIKPGGGALSKQLFAKGVQGNIIGFLKTSITTDSIILETFGGAKVSASVHKHEKVKEA